MRAILRIVLYLLAPFSGFMTASIFSLPGNLKSDGHLRWIPWGHGDPLYDHFHPIQEHCTHDWNHAYHQLLAVSTDSIHHDADEMGRYYNNVAVAAYHAHHLTEARSFIERASHSHAHLHEVTNAITHNLALIL